MAYDANTVLLVPGTQTVSTNSTAFDSKVGIDRDGLDARILVTAVSGTTPSMTVALQYSDDNVTFYTFAQGAPITAVGEYFIRFCTDHRYIRVATTITGTTPSFTFGVDVALAHP